MIVESKTVMPPVSELEGRNPGVSGWTAERRKPETMKAVYLDRKAGTVALVAGEIARPKPNNGEVLIKVHATSVTPAEVDWFTTFALPFGEPRPFPIVLSHEFSGVVESEGAEFGGLRAGDQVYGIIDWFANGAQAEYCVAKTSALARKPKSLCHVQSAVVPIAALSAWQGLFERTELKPGERVLIHGAESPVGIFAVQLARRQGAHVIAAFSSGNSSFVRSLGADELIDCRTTRFEDSAREVDVVFDGVGGDTLDRSQAALVKGGRVVTVGPNCQGPLPKHVRDTCLQVRADGWQLAKIGRLIDAGELRVFVANIFPLAAARVAYTLARQPGRRGKVALRVAEASPDYTPEFDH